MTPKASYIVGSILEAFLQNLKKKKKKKAITSMRTDCFAFDCAVLHILVDTKQKEISVTCSFPKNILLRY